MGQCGPDWRQSLAILSVLETSRYNFKTYIQALKIFERLGGPPAEGGGYPYSIQGVRSQAPQMGDVSFPYGQFVEWCQAYELQARAMTQAFRGRALQGGTFGVRVPNK